MLTLSLTPRLRDALRRTAQDITAEPTSFSPDDARIDTIHDVWSTLLPHITTTDDALLLDTDTANMMYLSAVQMFEAYDLGGAPSRVLAPVACVMDALERAGIDYPEDGWHHALVDMPFDDEPDTLHVFPARIEHQLPSLLRSMLHDHALHARSDLTHHDVFCIGRSVMRAQHTMNRSGDMVHWWMPKSDFGRLSELTHDAIDAGKRNPRFARYNVPVLQAFADELETVSDEPDKEALRRIKMRHEGGPL